ncbi:RNA methyltransferase, RsmD family [uncultured Eubacteriales bacterium]|uniref:RNA methyltransferase, RsmD family n=1 Tax=uncultured Eubacteriales bacterium TaxID=172733 RepID=A0A212J8W6_9FIRM|nr:RNA methyltransferase, RsmD family [uncultured Eubacteriales bacterium]
MRVITGTARGRRLKELEGMETRPTTDRVKEGLFNAVQFDIEGRRVLDLFAGTGQLGIEALSRGAASCAFVDLRRDAAALTRENLALCGFEDRGKVHQTDYLAFLSSCREKFDLILLDPPYAKGLLEKALETIAKIDIVSANGIIVCESALEQALPELPAPYDKGREYRYGKIKITLYSRKA